MRRSNNQGTDGLDREYAAAFWKRTFFSHFSKLVARVQKGHFKSHGSHFTLFISKDFFHFLSLKELWADQSRRWNGEKKKQIKDDRWHFCSSWNIFQKLWMKGVFFTQKEQHTIDDRGRLKNNKLCMKYFSPMVITLRFWPKINNRWLRVIKKQLVLHEIFSNNGDQSMFFGKEKNIKQLMIAVDWKHVRLAWNILD